MVAELRDFLYCFHDVDYFEHGDKKNETLTQSMLVEQISMSPKREPAVKRITNDKSNKVRHK